MFYYSTDTSGGALADTGLPSNFDTSFVGATESGTQFSYGPQFGPFANIYNGTSPGPVPEPTTLTILAAALLGFGAVAPRLRG
jgi:hypothetical protein